MRTPHEDGQVVPRAFEPLPLGSVTPRGWLRRQLEIQADGLTGSIDEVWEDLSNNAWRGGDRDGWERAPYYADGLVPLAYLLDDDELVAKADGWVEDFLAAQDGDGWFTPERRRAARDPDDPWPRYVVCKVLRQYYEATGDERALEAVRSFGRYMLDRPDDWSIDRWAAMRWMELAVTMHWLAAETGETWPLGVVDLLIERGFDWIDHFRNFRYPRKQSGEPQMETHVVNNAMGLKAPAVYYRQTGDAAGRRTVDEAIGTLDRYHGQATGLFTGDEHFSGKNPSQGTELCAVVEYMYSLEYLATTLGGVRFGDRLERIAYNALPATFTPDMWAHQYDQQANQVLCTVDERDWTNGPSANVFGQTPHYGCCHANFHQGWPKFAASLWARAPDGGIAAVAYAPSAARTTVDGVGVTVTEETAYPFGDELAFHVDVDEPVGFPLHLRIPEWATDAALDLPGGESVHPDPGEYFVVDREWTGETTVELRFEPGVAAERRYHGTVALSRGPLVFSLPVASERQLLSGEPPVADWEFHPTEPWNYGLEVDTTDPDASVEIDRDPPGSTPFSPADPPVRLTVRGGIVPGWELEDGWAGQPPASPTATHGEPEPLALVPYGCTMLRVTEFPLLAGGD